MDPRIDRAKTNYTNRQRLDSKVIPAARVDVIPEVLSTKGAAVTVRITEHDTAALQAEAAKGTDAKVARRLPALALVLEGCDRTSAAERCGMDRQTLRDSRILKTLSFSDVSVRPRNPKASVEDQEAHKKRMARPVGEWFCDAI